MAAHLIPDGDVGHSPAACCPCWPARDDGPRLNGTHGATYTHHQFPAGDERQEEVPDAAARHQRRMAATVDT